MHIHKTNTIVMSKIKSRYCILLNNSVMTMHIIDRWYKLKDYLTHGCNQNGPVPESRVFSMYKEGNCTTHRLTIQETSLVFVFFLSWVVQDIQEVSGSLWCVLRALNLLTNMNVYQQWIWSSWSNRSQCCQISWCNNVRPWTFRALRNLFQKLHTRSSLAWSHNLYINQSHHINFSWYWIHFIFMYNYISTSNKNTSLCQTNEDFKHRDSSY